MNRHETIYTNSLPPLPESVGTWIRLDRVARQGERVTFKVTYENAAGGQVTHRFNTLRVAVRYYSAVTVRHPHMKPLQGNTVSH